MQTPIPNEPLSPPVRQQIDYLVPKVPSSVWVHPPLQKHPARQPHTKWPTPNASSGHNIPKANQWSPFLLRQLFNHHERKASPSLSNAENSPTSGRPIDRKR
jgi:hypothetical protein